MSAYRSADRHAQDAHAPTVIDAWAPTRALTGMATEIMTREDGDAVTGERPDIGRLVGNGDRELFVSCGPVEAMQQQFDVLQPEYIVLHDIGCSVSRKLLASVAGASRRSLQKLVVRRQGFGNALATIEFLEWGSSSGTAIRLYTTEIDADPATRAAMAPLLLARSRLGVVVVGDLSASAIGTALGPMREAMQSGQWTNHELLMLPLTSSGALAQQAALLAERGLSVRTTPQVQRPADAWSYLSGTWNRMREQLGSVGQRLPLLASVAQGGPVAATPTSRLQTGGLQTGTLQTGASPTGIATPAAMPAKEAGAPLRSRLTPSSAPAAAPREPADRAPEFQATAPMLDLPPLRPSPVRTAPAMAAAVASSVSARPAPIVPTAASGVPIALRPMPSVPQDGPRPPTLDQQLSDYVGRVVRIGGMQSSCVIDLVSQQVLARTGTRHDHDSVARQALALMKTVREAATGLGTGVGEPELALTLSGLHLLLRTVPTHPTLMLVAVLDKGTGNLTLARLQIQRLDEEFDPVAL